MMTYRFVFLLAILSLTASACSFPLTNEPQSGDVLFQDNFSDPSSGWDRVNLPATVTDYTSNAYRIYVNQTNTDIWANPNLSFTDVSIEVDVAKVGGVDDNAFGLLCRRLDDRNFYFFIISSDGFYGIGKVKDGQQSLLGDRAMLPTDKTRKGSAVNHLRADCVGGTLTLYANGFLLAEQSDADFTAGDVGLMAGSLSTAGVDIYFDNFLVRQP